MGSSTSSLRKSRPHTQLNILRTAGPYERCAPVSLCTPVPLPELDHILNHPNLARSVSVLFLDLELDPGDTSRADLGLIATRCPDLRVLALRSGHGAQSTRVLGEFVEAVHRKSTGPWTHHVPPRIRVLDVRAKLEGGENVVLRLPKQLLKRSAACPRLRYLRMTTPNSADPGLFSVINASPPAKTLCIDSSICLWHQALLQLPNRPNTLVVEMPFLPIGLQRADIIAQIVQRKTGMFRTLRALEIVVLGQSAGWHVTAHHIDRQWMRGRIRALFNQACAQLRISLRVVFQDHPDYT
ncbi:hypothetical protein BKA62DRAFT_710785 [Auriculariales sp. MPI-PUGE-AT-0066]|nr:hypothetical protein BKA62DRAFT_710785 [Auriculariales sp. MPI-PUGE-AT-0066]